MIVRTVLATLLIVVLSSGDAGARPVERGNFGDCGRIDLGYTKGEIKAFGMSCKAAKELFRAWQGVVKCPDKPCAHSQVGPFNCRFGGTDVELKLRCTDKGRERAMKAHWGG